MEDRIQDRNLLVAVIALQMDYITQTQMVEAMKDWVFNRSETMEAILERRQFLRSEHADFLKAIVLQHLNIHKNDVAASLAALSSFSSTQKQLDGLDDQLDATIQAVSKNRSQQFAAAADSISFDSPEPDLSISNRFKILKSHAKGGLGEVSIATDTELNREVAIKQIQQPFDGQTESRHRFLAEAEITGKLEHPGIVPVYSLGCDDDGRPFYAMRFIRGDSLKEALNSLHKKNGDDDFQSHRFRMRQLVGRLVDVCNAINYAHSRGILHRDLKPGNIMLGRYGETLVVDWGLAKPIGRTKLKSDQFDTTVEETLVPRSGEGSTETRMGSVVGTLAYMSPEQADGRIDSLGPWSDVYGLGATLYSIITGRQPIKKAEQTAMLRDISQGKVVPLESATQRQDPAIQAICMKAMALKPDDRYESAGVLAEDLERWLADEPVVAFPEPLRQQAFRWVRRHQTFCTTSISLLILTAIGSLIALNIVSGKNEQLLSQQTKTLQSQEALQVFSTRMLEGIGELTTSEGTNPAVHSRLLLRTYDSLKPLASDLKQPEFKLAFSDAARAKALMSLTKGNNSEALQQFDEAIDILQGLSRSEVELKNSQKTRSLATMKLIQAYGEKSGACRRKNQFQEAHAMNRQAAELLPQLLQDADLSEFEIQMLKGRTTLGQAITFRDQEDWMAVVQMAKAAREDLTLAQSVYVSTRNKFGINPEIYGLLAAELQIVAMTMTKQFESAKQTAEQEISELRSAIEKEGMTSNRRYALALILNANSHNSLAANTVDNESLKQQIEAVDHMQTRYQVSKSGGLAEKLCDLDLTLARCYFNTSQEDEAIAVLTAAIQRLIPHTTDDNAPARYFRTLAMCYEARSRVDNPDAQIDQREAARLADHAVDLSGGLAFYSSIANRIQR